MIFITDELGKFEKNIIELAENVGFKECKTIEAIDLFCGISEKNDVLKEKDRYYAFIDIPQYWSVRADGLNGAIYDNKTKKANIYFKNPIEKRMVSRVEWIDRNNTVYKVDYYNKYGYMYCSENVSGGNVTVREFYDRNGDIKVLEQTGPKTYTTFGTRISPKSYRGFADYLEAYLKYNKIYDENIWLTSDEILNKFAWDYGNFKISYLPQNRLNSDLTVITRTNTAFRILCSEEQQVNWYKENSNYKCDRVYSYFENNELKFGKKEALTITESDQLEYIEQLINDFPEITFHIAASTIMSDKLTRLDINNNVELYPCITEQKRKELFERCDIYLDINHYRELYNAVNEANVMAIRASLQTVRFYVDGSLRAEYDTKDTRPFGKDSASRYVFCNMSEDDAGKELRIELTSHASNYSGVVNTVYCGEKSDIWTNIFHNSSRETIIAFFIFFAAVVSVMFSIALSIVYKTHFDMEYVGWCMLLGAIWMLGESKLRQMLVPNASVLAAMCFVVILISPIAVSIYIDSIQGGRYTRVYTCIEALAAVNFIVCTALQLFGVCDYIETLPAGQGMLAVCCAVVITTFIIDIIKHRTLGYRPEMVAMIIALVLVLIEAASVYFVVTMSGFFIGTGLIVILFVNIIVTIKRISEIEYKRQKEESDRLRNQTERVSLQMMKTLAATIEAKDDYMRGHSYRVAEYSALIAKQLGWSEHEVENLRNAAYLHDIGKIGVPDTILNKPTRLTDEEFAAIKSHTVMGADILKDITLLDHLVDIARNHHERYDGKGYPDGLVGEEIPLSARIVCVADSYDAMKSRRIYRNALPDEEIRRELLDNCGTQFDPQISRMFVDMLDNGMVVIDEDNPAAQGYRDNAAIESVADKFISEVMKTMSSQEKADSVDYLTGLYMRSRGQQVIAALMQDNDGCLAFIDMDNLKKVNDVHGHKAGDRALKLIGNLLAKETENETFAACRLGGDEFLIFMPYSDRASVESVIKRIFEGFESAREADCEIKEAALSAGLCMTTKGAMFESDYTKADKALYYVKQNCKGSYFFYEQLLADNKENTNLSADLRNVAKLLKESGSYTGALDLNYREFARIYEFVNNVGDRHNHNCYLVMVTMNTLPEQLADIEEIEKALDCMEQSIRSKIRKVDICTRYSSMQYLIILFEPQENQIPNVMERIFMHYYELCDRENFKPQYEYIKMTEVK